MSALDTILSQPKITHDLIQGTPEWDQFRLAHRGASEAAAVLGLSKNVTRNELLHAKHTGIAREFSRFVQERVLDKGHEVEALARPIIEAQLDQDLYPVTCSRGGLSASSDGVTLDDDTIYEHKQWNDELAAQVAAGVVPDEHLPQCQQLLLVHGARRVLFVVSNGTPEKLVQAEVLPDRAWWERIASGWAQFDADLAVYEPADISEMPKAEVTIALPALFIHAKGEITTSNMKEYGVALAARLEQIRSIQLLTDQDFSNAKESAKLLRENIEAARLAKDAMLAQTVTVGEAARMIDAWCEDMRLTALQLEKDVEREDKAKKAAMIAATKEKYAAHVQALETEIAPARLQLAVPVFAEAIKNKRSFTSMQDALDTMLANAKIDADGVARRVRENQAYLKTAGAEFGFLFVDASSIVHKAADDLKTLVDSRIATHKAAEAKKEEEQRERIRKEEQAKAEKAARDKIAAEQRAAQESEDALIASLWANARRIEADRADYIRKAIGMFESAAKDWEADPRPRVAAAVASARQEMNAKLEAALAREAAKPALPPAAAPVASPAVVSQAPAANSPNVVPMVARAAPSPTAPPTLRLGQLNELIAPMTIDAAGLAKLGFAPAATDKSAKLYHHSDFSRMVDSMIAALRMAQQQQQAA